MNRSYFGYNYNQQARCKWPRARLLGIQLFENPGLSNMKSSSLITDYESLMLPLWAEQLAPMICDLLIWGAEGKGRSKGFEALIPKSRLSASGEIYYSMPGGPYTYRLLVSVSKRRLKVCKAPSSTLTRSEDFMAFSKCFYPYPYLCFLCTNFFLDQKGV